MAIDSGRPAFHIDPRALLAGEEEETVGEAFEIALEEELVQEYDFTTLFKANDPNLEEHRLRYNMACKAAEQRGDIAGVAELVDIRFEARRQGMENIPIILEVSPFTDEGAALCYGYVEGALERIHESTNLRRRFEEQYLTVPMTDGAIRTVKVS